METYITYLDFNNVLHIIYRLTFAYNNLPH